MSKEKIYIFDTTLRDGAQTEGVNFTIEDKNKIAKTLLIKELKIEIMLEKKVIINWQIL